MSILTAFTFRMRQKKEENQTALSVVFFNFVFKATNVRDEEKTTNKKLYT